MYSTRTLILLAAGAPCAHVGPYIDALRARPDVTAALAWLVASDASGALKDAARRVVGEVAP
jgi:hypothetical protein